MKTVSKRWNLRNKCANIVSNVARKLGRQGPTAIVSLKNSQASVETVVEAVKAARPACFQELYVIGRDGKIVQVVW